MMDSWALNEGRRRNMQANRHRDTTPELRLRRIVHSRGLRYFVNRRALPSVRWKADLVFPRNKVAVFVDGCYWHGCPEHYSPPKRNSEYWGPKIAGNKARDAAFDALLADAGWHVIRVWEHEDPLEVASCIEALVRPPIPS